MADRPKLNITSKQKFDLKNAIADFQSNQGSNISFIEPGLKPVGIPSATPSVSITPSLTPSISVTPSVSVTPSISITPSISVTPSLSITPSVSKTPSVSVTPSISVTPSVTISSTPSVSISATPSISVTPSASISITPSESVTPSVSLTPSITISITPSTTPSISVTPSTTPSSTSGIVTSGLVFNLASAPTSGTTWTDATGNGYNATLNGTSSYTSSFSGGIQLANANNYSEETGYISVPYNITSSAVTVEIVASFNPTDYWGAIWGNEVYDSDSGYFAYMDTATSVNYGKSTSESSETVTASDAVRHWVFVINGTSHSLYLNGIQVGTTDTVSIQTLFASNNFYFGARHTNAGTGFTDVLNNSTAAFYPAFYQMRVYGRGLSLAEITQNFNAIKGTYGL